jgi:hypothetical protein
MINFKGIEAKEKKGFVKHLPVGAYVGKVIDTQIKGNRLMVLLDVTEGPYKDFYMKKYKAQAERGSQYGDPKYKGVVRINIPSEQSYNIEKDTNIFNDMIWRFMQSNPNYKPDLANGFDETSLKGLMVGFSTQECEYNGFSYTEPARFESVDDVRAGKVEKMPKKKSSDENPTPAPMVDQRSQMEIVTEKLPWPEDNERPY